MEATALPDNILSKVARVRLIKEISKKTGKPYYQLEVQFINEYTYRAFCTEEQAQLVKYAMKTKLDTNSDTLGLND